MENICDRILELDNGRCFMHDFGGPGAYQQFKEVRGRVNEEQGVGGGGGAAATCTTLRGRGHISSSSR